MAGSGLRVFDGAVVVMTGGASGIGRAMSEELARRGADVMIADRQIELAEEVAAGIRSAGGKASAAELDVTDFEAFNRLVQETAGDRGRLDYIFNNAGIGVVGEVRHYQIEDWNRVLDVNIRGVVHGVQAAYPIMVKQGFGHIVNTASMAGLMPAPTIVGYATSKHAVVGLSKSLRIEAEALGIRVSAFCPGVIRTAILDDGGKYGKSLEPVRREAQIALFEKLKPMDANRFAVQALNAVAKNKLIIVIPSKWKIAWWLNRLSPAIGQFLARKQFETSKTLVETEPDNSPAGAAT